MGNLTIILFSVLIMGLLFVAFDEYKRFKCRRKRLKHGEVVDFTGTGC